MDGYRSVNPASGRRIAEYPCNDSTEIGRIIATAERAFRQWSSFSIESRGRKLLAVAEALRGRRDELARLMTAEMGKPIASAEAEVAKCAAVCEYFAHNAARFLEPQTIPTDATRSEVRFDPLGVILAIMPWNFPFWQVFRAAAPALMAGNTVILKHAPNVGGCAAAIEDLFRQTGPPEDVLLQVRCDTARIQELIENPAIAGVTLTGSFGAGRAVAAAAGRALKKCVLELGGSDPFIVLEDVDIEKVAADAVAARCINNGQSCIAAKRFLVARPIYAEFLEAFGTAMARLRVGDPADRNIDVGPLARLDLLETLHGQVLRSVADGARLVRGGKRLEREGYFYEPTILADVRPGMAAFDEETFGSLAAVMAFDSADQAVELANRSAYGLGCSVWSDNIEAAEAVGLRVQAGNLFINGVVKSDPRLPFGGVKNSGLGRELGAMGIHEFTNVRTVWVKAGGLRG
jgi:acyl-CoA reductase-like NAD-dependent aldehyde dehydrogenase